MSVVDDLIAALTLAIDHANPSQPSAWVLGTASRGDQAPVPQLIADLQNASANSAATAANFAGAQSAASAAASAYTTSHAAWLAGQTTAFAAWDRGLRALETLILAASPSAPVDPTVHITTGDIPGAEQRSGDSRVLAKSLGVSMDAIRGFDTDRQNYFDSLRGEPQPDALAVNAVQVARLQANAAQDALNLAIDRAQQFLNYLAVT